MKTILIVDDDQTTRNLISRILSHAEELAVITAANGQEAIEIINKTNIDLIITDIVMPVMDGFELLSYISENCPEIPVFVMTAHDSPEIDSKIRSLNIAQYFIKPLNMDEFKLRLFDELESGAEGQIHGIGLVSFMQLVEMESKTCTLNIRSKTDGKAGKLYFFKGELTTAEAGELTNEKAVYEIVSWEKTTISIEKLCKKQVKEIAQPLLNILMEGIRIKDEKTAQLNIGKNPLKMKPKAAQTNPKPVAPAPAKATVSPEASKKSEIAQQDIADRARLANALEKLTEVVEYCIFDPNDSVVKTDSRSGTTAKVKPSTLFALSTEIGAHLEFSLPISFMLNTENGHRYVMFRYKNNQIIVSLKSGFSQIGFLSKLKLIKI